MEVKYPNGDTEQMVGWVIESATKEIQGWINGERGHLINQNNEEKMNLVPRKVTRVGQKRSLICCQRAPRKTP